MYTDKVETLMLKYPAIMNLFSFPRAYVSLRSAAVCNVSFVLQFAVLQNAATTVIRINALPVASKHALQSAVVCDAPSYV